MIARARAALLAALALLSARAWAGGMTLPVQGARALGRAGAFVAGADDGAAMIYDPAGLADVPGVSLLFDGGFVLQRTRYTRVDSGGNPQPTVDGAINGLPFPTVAVTYKPRRVPWLTLHAGGWTPYQGVNAYPEDGPQRYSAISLAGSLAVVLQVGASFRVHPHVWLGVGIQDLVLRFRTRVALSACPELTCAPEDPRFDALTQLDVVSGFTPSAIVGMTVVYPRWRAGLSLQLPYFVRASGETTSRLPSDPFYAGASLHGSAVDVAFDLPPILRVGVEYRPLPVLRLELDVDYEAWSIQRDITIAPRGIYIDGVPGIGRYDLATMHVARDLRDVAAVHLGAEWEAIARRLFVRAGYMVETSATPDETMSVLTSDGLHNLVSLGLGVEVGRVRLDLGYAHLFTTDRTVTSSRALQLNPVQPSLAVPVGNGRYEIATDLVALGLSARL